MSEYSEFFTSLKVCESYGEKGRILEVLLNSFRRKSSFESSVSKSDLAEMKSFVFDEISALTDLIPTAPDYKTKDELFYYEDKLLGLFMFLSANKVEVSDDEVEKINALVNTVAKYQVLETAISDMYKLDKISGDDVKKVIEIAKPLADEYQKGLFFQGLLNWEKDVEKFTADAKTEIANYISSEMERYLKKDKLTEDEINNLEIASDICKNFIDEKTIPLLKQILNLTYNNVRYYAVSTLISCNQTIPASVINDLAQDLNYADLTYHLLKMHRLEGLFPTEFTSPEYLAKSDMVHWLTYPTELGKMPDEIVLLGDVKVKGEKYYIFKYKSDSDTLSDDSKNEWLIGWSSDDGGTFSNFDKLCDYEQKKPAKTLKVIKKKLLG